MTDAEIREFAKVNLQIANKTWDEYIEKLIGASKDYIKREGITLDVDNIGDCNIVAMYAAYLFQKRQSNEPMPRMLRYELNNRLMAEKMRGDGTSDT